MKVRIIEKIYHHTNSPTLSTPYRTDRELFWIKKLGTAMPYGCNGFCILESKSLKVSCNVLGLEDFLTLGC
jgi:hypothetical protein